MKQIAAVLLMVLYSLEGTVSLTVNMNSIEAPLGTSNVQLICSYEATPGENVQQIYLKVFIESAFQRIATFFPTNEMPRWDLDGLYLSRRGSLSNPTENSTAAILTIFTLACIDEADYQCEISYDVNGTIPSTPPTATSNITVRGYAQVPDSLPIMSPSLDLQEGQNVTFTCSGIVGDPPGKFIWEKYRLIGFFPTTYPNELTVLASQFPGECVYTGSSSLTITVQMDDDNAFVRCKVDQELSEPGLFTQTEPFRVYYSARDTEIFRDPDLPVYNESNSVVVLECLARGNPTPTLTWYKDGEQLSKSLKITVMVYTINSGNYTCLATNVLNGKAYEDSASTVITIAPNITGPTDTGSTVHTEKPFAILLVICTLWFFN